MTWFIWGITSVYSLHFILAINNFGIQQIIRVYRLFYGKMYYNHFISKLRFFFINLLIKIGQTKSHFRCIIHNYYSQLS